jgi:hypothetical protein
VDNWALASVAREAWINVFGVGSRLKLLVALSVAMGVTVIAVGSLDSLSLRGELRALEDEGANIVVFRSIDPNSPAQISRTSCEALASSVGVDRAGLIVYAARASVSPIGFDLPVVRASTTLFPDLSNVDLVIGSSLGPASEDPYFVQVNDSQTPALARTSASVPDTIGTDASVVAPLQPDDLSGDQCLVVLDPRFDVREVQLVFGAQLAVQGGGIAPIVENAPAVHPVTRFDHRITEHLPILMGLVGGLVCALAFRFRTSEIATYRLSGTGRRSLLLVLGFEISLIAGVGAVASAVAGLVLSNYSLSTSYQVEASLMFGASCALVGMSATAPLAWINPIALAKDN